jgi:hypothetical protein
LTQQPGDDPAGRRSLPARQFLGGRKDVLVDIQRGSHGASNSMMI